MIRLNKIVQFLFLTVILFLPGYAISQNYSEDMSRIMEIYRQGDVSFRMKYLFYPFDSVKKAKDSMNISCYMSKGEYCYKVASSTGSYEYVKNNRYYFVVDNAESAMAVRKSSEAKEQSWDISKLDSVMHFISAKTTYKSLGNDKGEYTMSLPDGPWNKISIVFDKSNYRLVSMHMFSSNKGKIYGETFSKPVIAVYYTDYSEKALDKSLFSEERYFHDDNKNILLSDSYRKYKLLDYVYKLKSKS